MGWDSAGYNPWASPVFPNKDDAAMQPETYANPAASSFLSQIAGALGRAFMAPGQALASTTPITSDQMVAPAMDMAGMATLGAGAAPAGANELRAGIRPYNNVPDSLMGYRKGGPQRGFEETSYPHSQDVAVTFQKTPYSPEETIIDQVKGMNPDHALERAWRNWPTALHIQAIK